MSPVLSRGALRRVLQSLLETELKNGRGYSNSYRDLSLPAAWPDDLRITGDDGCTLACDSLEVLRLSAATNEMFHLYESKDETNLLSALSFGRWLDIIEAAWRSGVSCVTFTTSGSTGIPKCCSHELTHLRTEIQFLAHLFSDRKRIVSLTRPHHIYGFLFSAMLADQLDVEVLPAEGLGPSELLRQLRAGDLLVSIPDRWQWLDRSIPNWADDINGVVSTAPCPFGLITSLTQRGLGSMTEVYGSSETAGIAIRRWPNEDYRLMPQWKLKVSEEVKPTLIHSSGVQIEMMDKILVRGPDTFVLNGRCDSAVQVGGTNVFPDRIAPLLRGVPGVFDAAVRLMRPDEGTRLKAFIVVYPGRLEEDVRREVELWAQTNLLVEERPKLLRFGPALPTNKLGKPCDW